MGEIVAVEADGFTVVCADGRFKVTRVQPADGKKIEAGEWAKSANLKTGHREGGDPVITGRTISDHTRKIWNTPHARLAASIAEVRHRNLPGRHQAAHPRHRQGKARHRAGEPRPYGHYKAKVSMDYIKSLKDKKNGKLILVTAISPTPAGEGKTTTTVGLTDALNHIGKKAMLCLREPSLGPSFGMKGGAAGGGYAQVVPMEDINLHFTGDFHAITSAHNLLSALIDNHIYWGNALGIDSRRVVWRRVMDMNDRALREIVCSLGGVANGYPREAGFDITVASEVMAIFCLANDLEDLKKRLGNIIVAYTRERKPVRAATSRRTARWPRC